MEAKFKNSFQKTSTILISEGLQSGLRNRPKQMLNFPTDIFGTFNSETAQGYLNVFHMTPKSLWVQSEDPKHLRILKVV